MTRLAPYERDVNTVFQDYALFPHMTVGENVGYGLKVRRVARAERRRRIASVLEMVRLDGFAVSVSIGHASSPPAATVADVLAAADAAMYETKALTRPVEIARAVR